MDRPAIVVVAADYGSQWALIGAEASVGVSERHPGVTGISHLFTYFK